MKKNGTNISLTYIIPALLHCDKWYRNSLLILNKISKDRAFTILLYRLLMRKLCLEWVVCLLTLDQKRKTHRRFRALLGAVSAH